MDFGWDLGKRPRREMLDAAIVELLPLQALRARAFGAGSGMQQTPRRERPWKRLGYAALLREVARRSGDAAVLARAAAAADLAAGEADGDNELRVLARLDQAETALLTHELFGEAASLASVQSFLDAAEGSATASTMLREGLLRARLAGRRALASGDVDALEVTVKALELLGARLPAGPGRSAQAASAENACDRGELLLGLAVRLKDRDRLKALNTELTQVAQRLDADDLPLTFARATALRGQTLAALGDLDGAAGRIADGMALMVAAAEAAPDDYSPIDRARYGHGIGRALSALGEACDEDGLFDHAIAAFDQALAGLDAPGLALRPVVAHDRAAATARRAERQGDLDALMRAETAFKAELRDGDADQDPVAWATVQLALAEVYQARARLTGQVSAGAGPALNAAFDVFAERGMKILAEAAGAGLRQLRGG